MPDDHWVSFAQLFVQLAQTVAQVAPNAIGRIIDGCKNMRRGRMFRSWMRTVPVKIWLALGTILTADFYWLAHELRSVSCPTPRSILTIVLTTIIPFGVLFAMSQWFFLFVHREELKAHVCQIKALQPPKKANFFERLFRRKVN